MTSVIVLGMSVLGGPLLGVGQEPQHPYRSGVDYVEIDVQVVDREGMPVAGLGPSSFEVTIGGRLRQVQFAEFVGDTRMPAATRPSGSAGVDDAIRPFTVKADQSVVVAIDGLTFDSAVSKGVGTAVGDFVRTIPPGTPVGLYSFPLGPRADPTTDHDALVKSLDALQGQREPVPAGSFRVRGSEMVDFLADERSRREITLRYCPPPDAPGCGGLLTQEITAGVASLEAQARASLGMLLGLVERLAAVPGRKVLVLVSAGMTISERPGGRPDVGRLPIELGEAAARGNVAIYTLFLDDSVLRRYSSENRAALKQMVNLARDADLAGRWLEQFSGSAGGAFIKVMTGNAETAFTRIIHETSAYYVLGVEATATDQTGRALPIRVRVNERGFTVRSRQWVVVR